MNKKLPGKIATLPYFEYHTGYPTTPIDQQKSNVIFGVKSLGELLKRINILLNKSN